MNVRAELISWIQTLPLWQSDLLRRVVNGAVPSDSDLKSLIPVIAANIVDPTRTSGLEPFNVDHLPHPSSESEIVKVISVGNLTNVGSVKENHTLEFWPEGLTVIFGNNASGKSTYARVLKKACRAVDTDDTILPNVFEPESNDPGRATIKLTRGSESETIDRTVNDPPIKELSSISVFDSGCAYRYVADENAIAYVPPELRVFERLADLQIRLQNIVQLELSAHKTPAPVLPPLKLDSRVKQLVEGLSEDTSESDLIELATVSPAERERLRELDREAIQIEANDPRKLARLLRLKINELSGFRDWLLQCRERLAGPTIEAIKQALDKLATTDEAVKVAFEKVFNEEPIRGIGSEAWQLLWEAARTFVEQEAFPGRTFPVTDGEAPCPLCLQELSAAAVDRFNRFENFVRSRLQSNTREAKEQLRDARLRLENMTSQLGQYEHARATLEAEAPDLHDQINSFLTSLKDRAAAVIKAIESGAWGPISALTEDPCASLSGYIKETEFEAKRLETLAVPEHQQQMLQEREELYARTLLAERLPEILKWLKNVKYIRDLRKLNSSLNTAPLTTKQKELTEKVVTQALRESLDRELTALNCSHLPVTIGHRGHRGQTLVGIQFRGDVDTKTTHILSEGEQRALSLAFFLAEAKASNHLGGIILDDPVSSLDHLRRKYVAKRLVEEAARRQVIVFTHDLVFLLELKQAAHKAQIQAVYHSIERLGKSIGLIRDGLPWIALGPKKRIRYLRQGLQRIRTIEAEGDVEKYRIYVQNWLQELRQTWERIVEVHVLNGAVQRFGVEVRTKLLEKVLADEIYQTIDQEMTFLSTFVHDNAPAINVDLPSTSVLEEHLETADRYIVEIQQRNR